MNKQIITVMVLCCVMALTVSVSGVSAEDPNVGVLRIYDVQYPRQVAPSSHVSFTIDIEYAVRDNASIKSNLFEGTLNHLGPELWHSDPVQVSGGGDQLWAVNLSAPTVEGEWMLTVFTYYQEGGAWHYYNDTDQGPGFLQFNVKVAKLTQLVVDLGVSGTQVQVGDSSGRTASDGTYKHQFPVGENVSVSVPAVLILENSTRLVFQRWQSGGNSSSTIVWMDGDVELVGVYAHQYLLQVNSPVAEYAQSTWHIPGSNVTLEAGSVPMDWPLGALGLRYVFKGWTGDVTSNSNKISLVMDTPKVVSADFTPDVGPLIFPLIVIAGIVGGVVLSVVRRRAAKSVPVVEVDADDAEITDGASIPAEEITDEVASPKEASTRFCDGCGKAVEESWTHCIHCGQALSGPSEPVQS
jgi:hypothetical protein